MLKRTWPFSLKSAVLAAVLAVSAGGSANAAIEAMDPRITAAKGEILEIVRERYGDLKWKYRLRGNKITARGNGSGRIEAQFSIFRSLDGASHFVRLTTFESQFPDGTREIREYDPKTGDYMVWQRSKYGSWEAQSCDAADKCVETAATGPGNSGGRASPKATTRGNAGGNGKSKGKAKGKNK